MPVSHQVGLGRETAGIGKVIRPLPTPWATVADYRFRGVNWRIILLLNSKYCRSQAYVLQ